MAYVLDRDWRAVLLLLTFSYVFGNIPLQRRDLLVKIIIIQAQLFAATALLKLSPNLLANVGLDLGSTRLFQINLEPAKKRKKE